MITGPRGQEAQLYEPSARAGSDRATVAERTLVRSTAVGSRRRRYQATATSALSIALVIGIWWLLAVAIIKDPIILPTSHVGLARFLAPLHVPWVR